MMDGVFLRGKYAAEEGSDDVPVDAGREKVGH